MNRIVSFAWTSAPLVAGAKTVTRRNWREAYASRFRPGDSVDAYDRRPDYGGQRIAVLRVEQAPYREPARDMPDGDYEAEGFAWLHAHPECCPATIDGHPADYRNFSREAFDRWRASGSVEWVLRFALAEVTDAGFLDRLRERLAAARSNATGRRTYPAVAGSGFAASIPPEAPHPPPSRRPSAIALWAPAIGASAGSGGNR